MAIWFFALRIFPVALTSLQRPGPGLAEQYVQMAGQSQAM
jgi:hypothetical protein